MRRTKIMWSSTETAAGVELGRELRAVSAGSVSLARPNTAAGSAPEASVPTMSPAAAAGSVSTARPTTSHLSPTPKAGTTC